MDNQTLQSAIQEAVPSLNSIETKQLVEVAVSSENLHDTLLNLKNNAQLRFDFLVCQTGVDLNQQLGVFYHLRSTSLVHDCLVKCMAPNRNEAELPTSSHIWPAAIYFEREIFDLFGIRFTGHPNMKRIFLEDDFVGHPFCKDFEDPINIITKQ